MPTSPTRKLSAGILAVLAAALVILVMAGLASAADKQMGSFLSESNAKGLVSKLKSEGKDAYIVQKKIKGKLFHIVYMREGAAPPKQEPKPEPKSDPKPEPKPEPAPVIAPVPVPAPAPPAVPEPKPEPVAPEPVAPKQPVSKPVLPEGVEPIAGLGTDFSLYYPNTARLYRQPLKESPVIMTREKAGAMSTLGTSGKDWYAVKLYSTNETLYVPAEDVIRYSLKRDTAAPAVANAAAAKEPEKKPEKKPEQKAEDRKGKPQRTAAQPARREVFAVGGFLNPSNLSVGPMIIYKPFQNFGFGAMAGMGPFITAEARMFIISQSRPKYNPYLSAGFLYTQAKAEVLGTEVKFDDSGYNISLGLDANYGKGWHGFFELGYNNLELKGKVTSGTRTAVAEVDHSSITGTFGMVKYF